MNLDLDLAVFKKIREGRQVGSQAIEVRTDDGRDLRITAARNLAASEESYDAQYEELVAVETIGEDHRVWVRVAGLPDARGATVSDCLRSALSWIA